MKNPCELGLLRRDELALGNEAREMDSERAVEDYTLNQTNGANNCAVRQKGPLVHIEVPAQARRMCAVGERDLEYAP